MNMDLPENFYKFKAGGRRNLPKTTNSVQSQLESRPVNQPGQDPNLPENFHKFHSNIPKITNIQQSTPVPRTPCAPSDPETFELEQRLKRLSSKKSPRTPSLKHLESRLEKLQGLDKPIPTVSDLENRLNDLKDQDPDATELEQKRRKMNRPIIRVLSHATHENPEDLIKEAIAEADLGESVFEVGKRPKSVVGTGITEQMTPQELLDLIGVQMENSGSDDSTHDDFSDGLLTSDESDDDDLISEDDSKENKKIVHKEWKKMARELIQEAELEAKKAEKEAKKNGDFDGMI